MLNVTSFELSDASNRECFRSSSRRMRQLSFPNWVACQLTSANIFVPLTHNAEHSDDDGQLNNDEGDERQ